MCQSLHHYQLITLTNHGVSRFRSKQCGSMVRSIPSEVMLDSDSTSRILPQRKVPTFSLLRKTACAGWQRKYCQKYGSDYDMIIKHGIYKAYELGHVW